MSPHRVSREPSQGGGRGGHRGHPRVRQRAWILLAAASGSHLSRSRRWRMLTHLRLVQAMTSMPTSRTYFLDWLGMGLSGRPNFPHIKTCDETPAGIEARANAAEAFFVDSLEEFRDRSGIQSMTLVGHSIVRLSF